MGIRNMLGRIKGFFSKRKRKRDQTLIYNDMTATTNYDNYQGKGTNFYFEKNQVPNENVFSPERFRQENYMVNKLKNFFNWIWILLGVITITLTGINYFIFPFIMFFIYNLFPDEFELRMDAERQFSRNFPGIPMDEEHIKIYIAKNKWMFIIKSMLKLLLIISFPISIYLGIGNMLLVLISVFIGYFLLPSTPWNESLETRYTSMLRPFLGAIIGILFIIVFKSGVLALLSFAFFVYIPEGLYSPVNKEKNKTAGKILFIFIMTVAGVIIYWNWGLDVSSPMGITMFIIWIISLLTGVATPSESRSYIGVIILSVALIAYSSAFPTTVGTAVFGMWWPTIQHTISTITSPIGNTFEQMQTGLNDAWLMMTCPTCYYEKKQREEQIKNSRSQGSIKSIEITKFELLMPEIDPSQTYSLAGTIELENQGEFIANNVTLKLGGIYATNERGKKEPVKGVKSTFVSCTGAKPEGNECKWNSKTYPGDVKMAAFKYNVYESDLNKCNCRNSKGIILKGYESINCTEGCLKFYKDCLENEKDSYNKDDYSSVEEFCKDKYFCNPSTSCIKSYIYSGNFATLKAEYTYSYAVNVSLPVEIMDAELFEQKLRDKKIKPKQITSTYSGGPIKATIFTQKQPLRSGESSIGKFSIYNTGNGIINKSAEVVMFMPDDINDVSLLAEVNLKCSKDENGKLKPENVKISDSTYKAFRCKTTKDLDPEQYATFAFTFSYNIEKDIDTKSILFTGYSFYTYKGEKTIEVPIVWAPLIQN